MTDINSTNRYDHHYSAVLYRNKQHIQLRNSIGVRIGFSLIHVSTNNDLYFNLKHLSKIASNSLISKTRGSKK